MKRYIAVVFILASLSSFAQTAEPVTFVSHIVREERDGKHVLLLRIRNERDVAIRAIEYVLRLKDAFGDPIDNGLHGGRDFILTYEKELRPRATVDLPLRERDIEGLTGTFFDIQEILLSRVAFKDGTIWKAQSSSPLSANQRDPGLQYFDLPAVRGQTSDEEPAIFLFGISIGYKLGDQDTEREIERRSPELQATISQLLHSKKARDLAPPQYETLRADIQTAVNTLLRGRAGGIYLSMAVVQR